MAIFEFLKYVVGAFHEDGALAEQLVAAAGLGAVDGAGDCKNVTALLARVPRRCQRTATGRGLNDEYPKRESADETVSLDEIARDGRGPRGEFAEQGTAYQDPLSQRRVFFWVDAVEPCCTDGKSHAVGGKGTAVACGVDADCQAARDRKPLVSEMKGEIARRSCAVRGRVSATDHGELGCAQGFRSAAYKKHGRCTWQLAQRLRICGLVCGDELDVMSLQRSEVGGLLRSIVMEKGMNRGCGESERTKVGRVHVQQGER